METKLPRNRIHFTTLTLLSLVSLWGTAATRADSSDAAQSMDVSSAAGVSWEFKPESGDWKPIQVPAGGWRAQGYDCDAGTYRALITFPQTVKDRDVRLVFAAVNFGAEVWVGPDETHLVKAASHIDGWMPFSADLTPYAAPGSKLLVQVDVKGRKKFMRNGNYTVPQGATWAKGLEEGILRGVTITMRPKIHVEDVWIRAQVEPDTLESQVTITNATDQPAQVKITGHLSSWNKGKFKYPSVPDQVVTLDGGQSKTIDLGKIAWDLGRASYWWPNVPYRADYRAQLHQLGIALEVNGQVVDRYQQRFGFRQFQVHSNYYCLNGIRCNLRGDNQQEANFGTDAYGIKAGFGRPTADNPGWPKAVDNLLRLNFNVMRIHQIPATPYMLDVCDEMGLMLVGESPLRGSEGKEDFEHGRENMLNMDREMVLRDRNHPAIVIWSAANEWAGPVYQEVPVIRAIDNTRPIIADGVEKMEAPFINMQHYVNGFDLPLSGPAIRTDRPYGETEAVWDKDNTWQGFAWMATSIRIRRLLGCADLRNYIINNVWCNYVPGESDKTEILEKKVTKHGGNLFIRPPILDPWHNRRIHLMQQCYDPLAVCDVKFDRLNAASDGDGNWPTRKPKLAAGSRVTRKLAVFNDEFEGNAVTVRWSLRQAGQEGPVVAKDELHLDVPFGEVRYVDMSFDCPATEGDLVLSLDSFKDGQHRFHEDGLVFEVVSGPLTAAVPDGDYRLINLRANKPISPVAAGTEPGTKVEQNDASNPQSQVWHLTAIGADEILITHKASGLVLTIGEANWGTRATLEKPNGQPGQAWRLITVDDGLYQISNEATGMDLEVTGGGAFLNNGAAVDQWATQDREHHRWLLEPAQ